MSPRRETLGQGDEPFEGAAGPALGSDPPGAGTDRSGDDERPEPVARADLPLGAPGDVTRLVERLVFEPDSGLEPNMRPRRLSEFVGQSQLKERLSIILEAARRRGQPVDHVLFAGPPGLGKTTLAGIVAAEMGAGFRITSGPTLVRTGDVAAILTDLQPGDVLFIDEIHRLGRAVEEVLYPAMEDFQLDIIIGKGPTARSLRLELPRFTLVGATTRTGLVTGPLRDRFGIVARLEHYQPDELVAIVNRSAHLLGLELTPEAAEEIATRSRGTPRLALRLLRRVRDFVEVRGSRVATLEETRDGLDRFGVDELGLDHVDRTILETLCLRFSGRPVGLSTLAISVGEEPETVEDVYEPFLLKAGLIQRTPRGRIATEAAYEHLGVALSSPLVQLGAFGGSAVGVSRAPRGPGAPSRLFEAEADGGSTGAGGG